MKQIKDKIFVDTNILIYAYSSDELAKRLIVQRLLENTGNAIISTQVINEFINVMHKKKKISFEVLGGAVSELSHLCFVSLIDIDIIKSALHIGEKFRYSYYDSLIISAALMNNCTTLYSEDMQHQHIIENKLIIINPFKHGGCNSPRLAS